MNTTLSKHLMNTKFGEGNKHFREQVEKLVEMAKNRGISIRIVFPQFREVVSNYPSMQLQPPKRNSRRNSIPVK
jgi:hypothetical protein